MVDGMDERAIEGSQAGGDGSGYETEHEHPQSAPEADPEERMGRRILTTLRNGPARCARQFRQRSRHLRPLDQSERSAREM